jgi:hypothetical protein
MALLLLPAQPTVSNDDAGELRAPRAAATAAARS